jgi:hypothetical protein
MKNYILFILLFTQGLFAQVEFKAVPSKTTLGINEKLTVEFIMNGDGDNFVQPSFSGFTVSGPLQTISYPVINKKKTYLKTYTYTLSPQKRGTFTIGQASIEIGDKIYKTIPFKVTVTGAVQGGYAPGSQPALKAGEGIYIVTEVSNKSPYLNEPVTVLHKIYVDQDVDVSDYNQMDSPKYNGFWTQKIAHTQTLEEGMFKGKLHNFVTLEKLVIYPQQSGQLEIEPVSVEVFIAVPTGRVNALGRDINNIVRQVFSSEKVTINAKPLPEKGKPAGFNGAVGDFTFKVTPSKTTAASGESFQLDVSVSGKGNFKLFDMPQPVVPAALEMYDPEQRDNTKTTSSGLQGTFTDVYTIIPQFKGKFTIKPVAFSFFDPKLGIYRTIRSEEITVDVPTGPDATAAAYEDATATKKPAENDKKDVTETNGKSGGFFDSALFYVLVGLFLGLGIVAVFLFFMKKGKTEPKKTKERKVKQPQPHNLAKTYLAEAKTQLGNKEPFYISLEKALHNFLKAKLAIETSQMTKQNIRELLLSKGAERTTVELYISVMDNCAFARYAPSTGVEMQRDYDNAETAINTLEKQI